MLRPDDGLSGGGALAQPVPRSRPLLGIPKDGLRIRVSAELQRRTYRGRADPALLLLLLGTMLTLSLVGALAFSPLEGLTAAVGFALLFAPVLLFAVSGLLRLRTSCEVDRAAGLVRVREQSYRGGFAADIPLATIEEAWLLVSPAPPVVGAAERFSVCLRLPDADFQVLAASTESRAALEAEALAIFLGVPYRAADASGGSAPRRPLPWGGWAVALLLYIAPVALVAGGAFLAFLALPLSERLMLTSLGAIVASQIGAILAFAYRRGAAHTA